MRQFLPVQQYIKRRISEDKTKTTLDNIANIWSVIDKHNFIEKLPIFVLLICCECQY